ncbi:hypothetical protein EA462_00190 [Natrarchaeobius halalkaliphilus]|uniref:Uncharacterized protein n=1 Tax=Natrarchaeobius halalkaliphilus TaxID=1679091 RepID=A0A3N6LTB4_9EURY|nr:hypothetical protein [Natrarchaeobius halalkaliphilus]RQG93273.1 hypothetical protein EA462_00190 [Natrarchaeobius halalkaliphilus]
MTESMLEEIERRLSRARDLEAQEAVSLLRTARADLRDRESDPDVDEERRAALETRLEQRIREIENREAYDGGLGAAMNPDDDDAP